MIKANELKQVYIVISQTGTVLSRILKLITGAEYNHASISLADDLSVMYSFGRRNPYNPFWGGFVCESASTGLFKRFPKTEVIVLEMALDAQKHQKISKAIDDMKLNKKKLKYNYFGLILAFFKKEHRFKNKFYCSEFVKYILRDFDVLSGEDLSGVLQPIHFLKLPLNEVYKGTLIEYTNQF